MRKINIKPLSVNQAWKGRRYKTDMYEEYETELFLTLPKGVKIPSGPLEASYRFGVSSTLSDNDNPLKPFQDILSKMYDFNDKMIFRTLIEKVIVPKGQEFVEWDIKKLST